MKDFIGFNYFSAKKWMRSFLGEKICRDSMPTQLLCKGVIFMLMGYDSDQLNSTTLPVILGHTPAGCSTSQVIFCQNDYFSKEINDLMNIDFDFSSFISGNR